MDYFITRDGQQYGPYTLADLQRYVASGHIALSDLARSEGMAEPLPVSQIIGSIAVPQPPAATAAVYAAAYPDPPDLHWALVLLFGIFSCGLFNIVWNFIQAAWIKKVDPQSKATTYYVVAVCVLFAGFFFGGAAGAFAVYRHTNVTPATGVINLIYFVLLVIGRFNLKSSLEQHYNLALSGVMTFFFGDIYFQYHFNEINRRNYAARLSGISA